MTDLNFADELIINPFTFSNIYYYDQLKTLGLFFQKGEKNYPFILKSGIGDLFEIKYCTSAYQLRDRLLNSKRIKEVMNSARVPIRINLKTKSYLIGKGFLSTFSATHTNQILFIACIDDSITVSEMKQVTFYISREVYKEEHKALHPVIKDLVTNHPGDIVMCSNVLDYISEKIAIPSGGTIADRNKHRDAVIRTTILEAFK